MRGGGAACEFVHFAAPTNTADHKVGLRQQRPQRPGPKGALDSEAKKTNQKQINGGESGKIQRICSKQTTRKARVKQSEQVLTHLSLTADPSCEEMVRLEAFRRVRAHAQLNQSPSDISRKEDGDELQLVCKEAASCPSSVWMWRRARRNPAAGSEQQPISSERSGSGPIRSERSGPGPIRSELSRTSQ